MESRVIEFAGREFKTPPTERGQARWRTIVKVAERMFVERGYENVTLGMIVAESGGSLETVYKWFRSKEELFLAIFWLRLSEVQKIVEELVLTGDSLEEDIATTVESITSNVPFRLMRVGLMENEDSSKYQFSFLNVVEEKTNVPITALFRRIREKHGVEYSVKDEEMSLTFTRFFRGLALEIALGAHDANERLLAGKRLIVKVLMSLVKDA